MELATLWFVMLVVMLAVYVVLDGFDLGVGILHLMVARDDAERRACLRSIGPVWDANEVWLIAFGGTLYFAFPRLFAIGFSGFYLPLMMVLWLLIFRMLGIELRHHLDNRVWRPFWDAAFSAASVGLALLLGAALGNVVRGTSLSADGSFFLPLWTDLGPTGASGIIDWYTLLVGVAAVIALAHHGALWLAYRVGGEVAKRAIRQARVLWVALVIFVVALSIATPIVQPQVAARMGDAGSLVLFIMSMWALVAAALLSYWSRPRAAFVSSSCFLFGWLATAAYGIYPYGLPGRLIGEGLSIHEAAAPAYGLTVALWWWIPGMALAVAYAIYIYSHLPNADSAEEGGH